jgi:prolyl 3-hydroxylase /prolyl 3,4-dihydroxylase
MNSIESSEPFKHWTVHNFLSQKKFIACREALLAQKFSEHNADLFYYLGSSDLTKSSNTVITKLYKTIASNRFLQKIEKITNIKGLSHVDMAGFIYPKTGYLLPHDDRLQGRKIAYIYYLSTLEIPDGGALEFFNTDANYAPTKVAKSIQPVENTLILFEVNQKSFHQIAEVVSDTKRITVAGWFCGN